MHDIPFIEQQLNRLTGFFNATAGVDLLFAALLFALGAGTVFCVILLRRHGAAHRHARQITRIVRDVLSQAIDQRSTMEIEFSAEDLKGRMWSGPCVTIKQDTMTVAIGVERNPKRWIGEHVEVSFKIDHKGSQDFYRFFSQILDMRDGSLGITAKLALPSHILPVQKRHFVRISPSSSHLLGIGLWSLDATQPLPLNHTTLGGAALSYLPGKPAQCSLLNLSASGMRLEVPQEFLPQLPIALTLASHLLCLLMLRGADGNQRMPFWLACTVVSLLENPKEDTPKVIIGVKFRYWALSETGGHDIGWFPVGKTGEAPPLASWVLRHQLEQNTRS